MFQEVQSLVTSCIDGFNVCIFAYGQTGSGKTYTMEVIHVLVFWFWFWSAVHPTVLYYTFVCVCACVCVCVQGVVDDPGINQRALRLLFSEVTEKAPDWDYNITVSMVEIYNETLR